jgi:hypothetical protein
MMPPSLPNQVGGTTLPPPCCLPFSCTSTSLHVKAHRPISEYVSSSMRQKNSLIATRSQKNKIRHKKINRS